MDADIVLQKLVAGTDEAITSEQVRDAFTMGVTEVPFFILAKAYSLQGAQPAETLAAAFRQVMTEKDQRLPS